MSALHQAPEARPHDRKDVLRDPAVQQNAARLRVVTDRRQGKTTPQWVRDLANGTTATRTRRS